MIDLDALFRNCARDLTQFLRRRVASPEVAADLAQEAFFRLLRSDQGPGTPADTARDARAYLFSIAANLAIDHRRQAQRQRTDPVELAAMVAFPDPGPSAERTSLSREELRVLAAAVAGLPPRGREIFLMHKFEDLSYAEIAARLGIAKNTVIVHMVRSLAHCRRALATHRAEND
ncbi:RNA polymerase sigma factor [Dongia rigui]|uniref:RNA polymerase sigma factor n=1 Tax=Dongia rigui TaxID=940149 RepID=A0ABU5E239_9PROT|nr:RNA polymerase sigma factor [Dongia rigui]MDY0873553.1 RNA polymerase sigma factor [Dongia rigui]